MYTVARVANVEIPGLKNIFQELKWSKNKKKLHFSNRKITVLIGKLYTERKSMLRVFFR